MDTKNNSLYEKLLYNPATDIFPLKPLLIWKNANTQLNKKYKTPKINLSDTPSDLEIKNTARHITGLGLAGSQYGYLAYPIGYVKEGLDLFLDLFKPPYGQISQDVWNDTKIDLENNNKGINYIFNNPKASSDDLMDFAINLAREKQENKQSENWDVPILKGYINYNNNKRINKNKLFKKLINADE